MLKDFVTGNFECQCLSNRKISFAVTWVYAKTKTCMNCKVIQIDHRTCKENLKINC
jgi:hypothetical protein